MTISRTLGLAALFSSLSLPVAAQAFKSLPDQGPVVDKVCNTVVGPRKPGDFMDNRIAESMKVARRSGIATVVGNDCQLRHYEIDANNNLTGLKVFTRGTPASSPAPASAPAPATPQSTTPATTTAQTATTSTLATPSDSTGWWTIPGFLPAQVPVANIRLQHVRPTDPMRWRDEHCLYGDVRIPLGSGLIVDNRSIWRVEAKCKLSALVTVTRDPSQPYDSPATRFDSARELLDSLDAALGRPAGSIRTAGQIKGEAFPPLFRAGVSIQAYPGKAVVIEEAVSGALLMSKILAGKRDDATPFVLTAPATTGGTPLTGEWWNQPGLLPTSPQGSLAAAGRDAAGNCKLSLNNRPLATVPPGSLVIPDTTRAFAVLANCNVEPLITLPVQPGTTQPPVTVSGGGLRNPGNMTPGPNPGISNTSAAAAIPYTYPTAAQLFRGLAIIGAEAAVGLAAATPVGWVLIGTAAFYAGAIAYTVHDMNQQNAGPPRPQNIGPQALANRNAMGLDAEQFGLNISEIQQCKPCSPYLAGTIGYEGPHTSHNHFPYSAHLHLFRVNQQHPPSCHCFWNPNKPDTAPLPADPSWINLNSGFPTLKP